MSDWLSDEAREWREAAPEIRVIWNRTPKARREHLCGHCLGTIAVGEIYESCGFYEDGQFQAAKTHRGAYQYPSGCPRFRVRDLAEIAADSDDANSVAALSTNQAETLCSDCPPVGYPTDETRCLPCPRRSTNQVKP